MRALRASIPIFIVTCRPSTAHSQKISKKYRVSADLQRPACAHLQGSRAALRRVIFVFTEQLSSFLYVQSEGEPVAVATRKKNGPSSAFFGQRLAAVILS